jgi:hypothetical protein
VKERANRHSKQNALEAQTVAAEVSKEPQAARTKIELIACAAADEEEAVAGRVALDEERIFRIRVAL